jgi:hypothetical protein
VQEKEPTEFDSAELEPPSEKSRCDRKQRGARRDLKIDPTRRSQPRIALSQSNEIEDDAYDEERNGEVDKNRVLRVPGQEDAT